MERFPLGSKVLVSSPRSLVTGREGVVVCYEEMYVGVDFGDTFGGHDLAGSIKTDTGWYCDPDSLCLVDLPRPTELPEIEWDMIIK